MRVEELEERRYVGATVVEGGRGSSQGRHFHAHLGASVPRYPYTTYVGVGMMLYTLRTLTCPQHRRVNRKAAGHRQQKVNVHQEGARVVSRVRAGDRLHPEFCRPQQVVHAPCDASSFHLFLRYHMRRFHAARKCLSRLKRSPYAGPVRGSALVASR